MTAPHQSEIQQAFLRAPDLIVIGTFEGLIRELNPAFETILGFSREELLEQSFHELVHPDDQRHSNAEIRRLVEAALRERDENQPMADDVLWLEIRFRCRDGSYRWISWMLRAAPTRKLFYGVGRDITEQKRHEEDLRRARDAALEASQLKSQFLANMSHELRTPLNSIIGFSELLLDRIPGNLTDDQDRCVGDILDSGRHLLSLINDILDLAKIEAGKITLARERVRLEEVVQIVMGTVEPLAEKKKLTLSSKLAENLVPIEADPSKVRQILTNLFSNAVKFTPEGGHVEVRARRAEHLEDMLEVSVIDTGIGIDPAYQAIIFDEFRQIDGSATRQHEGTGLGLALCRRYLQLMDGEIWVESELGKGSRFNFVLPVAPEPSTPSETQARKSVGHVVIVEDDPRNAELMRQILDDAEYTVSIATNGDAGIRAAREMMPDVVITDILMPGKNGWEVLRELKGDPLTKEIPVVIASVVHNPKRADELGAFHSLVKPIRRQPLLATVKRCMGDPATLAGRTLLLVDDDPAVLRLGRSLLEEAGARVLIGGGGQEAIHLARSAVPDLLILDLMMPRVSGFDVVRELAGDRRTREIPILVMTAREILPEDKEILRGHIIGLVQKGGMRPRDLLQSVEQVFAADA